MPVLVTKEVFHLIIKSPVTQEQRDKKLTDDLLKAADKIILSLALRINALEDKEAINDDD